MSELPKKLGKRIAAERELLGMSQAGLAERIQVQPETISRLERGVFDPPLTRIESVAHAMGIALHDLLRFGADSPLDHFVRRFVVLVARRSRRDVEVALKVVEAVLASLKDGGQEPRSH